MTLNETNIDIYKEKDILFTPNVLTIKGSMLIEKEKMEKQLSDIFTSLAAGAIAGVMAKTIIAPLDRTKINFQISSDKKYSFRGAIRFLMRSYQNEGLLMLWRGNSATIVRIAPYAAIQYASHEQWKKFLGHSENKDLPPVLRTLAGSLAGVTASTLTYPLDMARARMAVTQKCTYSNLFQVFRKIYKQEQFISFYRGFTPTVLGVVPYAGTSFFTYETLKICHKDYFGDPAISHGHKLCYGAVAGFLGQSCAYPLDIVRRRMQTAGLTNTSHIYTSIGVSLKYIFENEGLIRGLYKGLSMNWIKGPLAGGVSFTVFEFCQQQLRLISPYSE